MICPIHRIALTSVGAKGNLKCPKSKCNYVVLSKDLRMYNRYKREKKER